MERVSGGRCPEALALLLTGRWGDPGRMVEGFRAYILQQGLSLDLLWVARMDGEPTAAVLLLPNVGRSAMVFVSPCRSQEQAGVLTAVLSHAAESSEGLAGYLTQVLLEPSQRLEKSAVLLGGYEHLADLGYLQRTLREGDGSDAMPGGYRVETADVAPSGWLERVILSSYERTLDCPSLVGRRAIEDIVAGHKATGVFDPTLWFILVEEASEEPVGVTLINPLVQPGGYELVYLGVGVSHRGRGLAGWMMRYAMGALCGRSSSGTLYLAVDQRNVPALKLYAGLGFRQTAERAAYLRML
ncbi:Mycothiol acetyltransferase [Mucisphaera calidilacus]|uniref:Mycothiol acetyltransferase n=2 Tax=Mucisphaera calidilacus TaxID=2527982 RepID=A0A518C1F5_9BACT|nr:Mycothiol acetyltransferase [Mucisphaera calidilacus]